MRINREEYRVMLEILRHRPARYVFPENDEDRIIGIAAANLYRAGLLYWQPSPIKHNGHIFGLTIKGKWSYLKYHFSKEHFCHKRDPWERFRKNELVNLSWWIALVVLALIIFLMLV